MASDGTGRARSDGMDREHRLAAALAQRAGEGLLELRSRSAGGSELGAAGDAWSHRLLVDELAVEFSEDRVRSEEADRAAELDSSEGRVWIVDPLDGTREYSEGRSDWAVHVALAVDGAPVVGAVALPGLGEVLTTGEPPALPPAADPPRLVVSRTRPPAFVPDVAEALGAEVVPMGSAGAKIAAVIRGEVEVYVHAGGQYEWDSAAPVAVALAAGLHASRLDGSPLRYSQPDPWLPDLVVCHPTLVDAVLAAVAASGVLGGE